MEKKPPAPDHPIHDLLRSRWSPRAFADKPVEKEKLQSLFEAARWAMSSYNEQPWVYLVAAKQDEMEFKRILQCLVPSNQRWAQGAAVLAISLAKRKFEKTSQENKHWWHDVGAASAYLTIQALSLDLYVHQMAGIEPHQIVREFKVPEQYEPVAGMAIGYLGNPYTLPEDLRERELAPRTRNPIDTFVFTGVWGGTSGLIANLKPRAEDARGAEFRAGRTESSGEK